MMMKEAQYYSFCRPGGEVCLALAAWARYYRQLPPKIKNPAKYLASWGWGIYALPHLALLDTSAELLELFLLYD